MASTEDLDADKSAPEAKDREPRERRAILDQMSAEAEELGLYDDPPPDYRAALKDARRRRSRGSSPPR